MGANGPAQNAIQNQSLRDLPRSRAISVARGTDAKKTMKRKIDHVSILTVPLVVIVTITPNRRSMLDLSKK